MSLHLLDAGGAALILIFPILILFLLLLWGFIEGLVIFLFGINRFWKSVWHAVVVNLVSLAAGFIVIGIANSAGSEKFTDFTSNGDLVVWTTFLVLSIIIEGLILKAMNRSKSWRKIFSASVVMNLISYSILYSYAYFTQ